MKVGTRKFELKNVKYSAHASYDTHCYQATLYVDGKRFCKVSNGGYGGDDEYEAIETASTPNLDVYKQVREINAELKQVPAPSDEPYCDIGFDLEIVCGELMNEWHQIQEVKKIIKDIAYIKDGSLYAIKQKRAVTPAVLEKLKNNSWWKSEYILLNEHSPKEAYQLLAENTGYFE